MNPKLPEPVPATLDATALVELRRSPARMGALAMDARTRLFGQRTLLRPSPPLPGPVPHSPALLRGDTLELLDDWPEPKDWRADDRVMILVEPDDDAAITRFATWLLELATHPDPPPASIAPFCAGPAGTHRLWLIAAARIALPAAIRVEARHDLIGIRLAQVALGFGADTLAGPIEPERHLPVAGVPRPNEATLTGLRKLIEQAGLQPTVQEQAP